MKNIIVLMSAILLSPICIAQEVINLNQGACWVQDGQDSLKVASFNEHKSYTIEREYLISLEAILKEHGLVMNEMDSMNAFVHCSSVGVRHVFKINYAQGQSYCLWSGFENGSFKKIDLDIADAELPGPCDGIIEDRIIVAASEGHSILELLQEVQKLSYDISHYEKIGSNSFALYLKTKGSDILNLRSNLSKNKKFKYVDLVTKQRPIGDYMALESLSFE